MSAYVLVDIQVTDPVGYEEYKKLAPPSLAVYGGRYVARGGKVIATPQLGNTQDVSCRAWLKAQGFKVTLTGGDVLVIPTANPDQLGLFQSGGVDAVWTVEPWVTRLEREASAGNVNRSWDTRTYA